MLAKVTRSAALVAGLVLSASTTAALAAPPAAAASPSTASLASTSPVAPAADPVAPPVVRVDDLELDVPAAAVAPQSTTEVEPSDGASVDVELATAPGRVATHPVSTTDAQTLGITWPLGIDGDGLDVEVRTRTDGVWSDWSELASDGAPDASTPDAAHARRGGTEALWIGDADAVQVSLDAATARRTDDIELTLVGSGPTTSKQSSAPSPAPTVAPTTAPSATPGPTPTESPAATPTESAAGSRSAVAPVSRLVARDAPSTMATAGGLPTATAAEPRVISRAEWGAPAQVCTPDVADGLVGAAVHHTADSNSYSTVAQAMQQIRNDAIYHIGTRGWCDIGYNFVVDKWGNIYEGRANSLREPVIGVHAGGFNTGTVGVAILGTYDAAPSAAAIQSVGRIIGWRLGAYRVDPLGTMSYYTGVGENSRFQNQTVVLPRVFGHRDVAYTACPGNGGFAVLPNIRYAARDAAAGWAQPPSSLMRTSRSATVFLVSGSSRYPIGDMDTLASLGPLGPLTYVPQQYLDAWATGPVMHRLVSGPDGRLYFFDAGIRLSFDSCDEVAEYGLACSGATPLEPAQLGALHYAGHMPNLYRTTSGKAFYIQDGTKREIADDASLAASGLPTASVRLLEGGLAYLPYGDPIVRDQIALHQRGGATSLLLDGSRVVAVPDPLGAVPGAPSLPRVEMDAGSLARITPTVTFAPFVRDATDASVWFLSERGRSRARDAEALPAAVPSVPTSMLTAIPATTALPSPLLLKGDTIATISLVRGGVARPIRSWSDLVTLAGSPAPAYVTAHTAIVRLLEQGPPYNPPGTLVRTAAGATVYLLDGEDRVVPVSSFNLTNELGLTRFTVVPDTDVTGRTQTSDVLRSIVRCGSQSSIGLGGVLRPIPAEYRSAFPAAETVLQAATCAALPRTAEPVGRFLRVANGTIFWMADGVKHPITSYARFIALAGPNGTVLQVSDWAAAQIPTGSIA